MTRRPEGLPETMNAGQVAYMRYSLRERRRMHQELAQEDDGAHWAWHSGADEALRQFESWLDMMRDAHHDWPEDWTPVD